MKYLRRLLMGMVVAAMMLLIAEGLLRLTLPVVRTATLPDTMVNEHIMQRHAYSYDPDLFWYWASLPVPSEYVNQYGFRYHKPMTPEKPAGMIRAITFGDSQTYGAGVGPHQTWAAAAERELGEDRWQVLNAGISGYRSLNIYRLLQKKIEVFQPDVIIIDCMPYDSARDDGLTTREVSADDWRGTLSGLFWHSRIYYALRQVVEKSKTDRPRWLDQAPVNEQGKMGYGNHDLIAAWADRRGIKTVFVQYPVWSNQGIQCMAQPQELPPGYPVAMACDKLKADGRPPDQLFQDTNHLTVAGNEVVGKAVAEAVATLGL